MLLDIDVKKGIIIKKMEEFFDCAFDANIQKTLEGAGGCKPFKLEAFPKEFHEYLESYCSGGDVSCCGLLLDYLIEQDFIIIKQTEEV